MLFQNYPRYQALSAYDELAMITHNTFDAVTHNYIVTIDKESVVAAIILENSHTGAKTVLSLGSGRSCNETIKSFNLLHQLVEKSPQFTLFCKHLWSYLLKNCPILFIWLCITHLYVHLLSSSHIPEICWWQWWCLMVFFFTFAPFFSWTEI